MSARDLLHRARVAGVQIEADNGELILLGEPHAVDALVPEVKACKAALLGELARPAAPKVLPRDLERRIEFVGKHHGFTPDELIEAKEIAAGDIENATVCFRRLLAEILSKTH